MRIKNTGEYLKEAVIPALITLVVFLAVIASKGIYPFGDLGIDYYDMGQTNAPLYYHLWDFMHGKGGLFYSWYIDEGQNLSMGSSIQWNISVFNLFFLFIKRSQVFKALSLFTGLRLFFMAFNMDLFLKKTIKTPKLYRIMLSVAYGLTGYTLTHYTITTYLDMAALMPLYLITLHDVLTYRGRDDVSMLRGNNDVSTSRGHDDVSMLRGNNDISISGGHDDVSISRGSRNAREDKAVGLRERGRVYITPTVIYALMTGYMTALGYYMAFMNLIFILLAASTYIFILCEKEERGAAAFRLGTGTFGGIGISAAFLFPAALQMMKSSRFNSNLSGGIFETLHGILWSIGADMYYIKWWLLSGSLAAIVIIVYGMIKLRSDKKVNLFFFLYCMYPCAMIVFESINLLWHMGAYYHYPIRCGYLIPIVLLSSAAYYLGKTKVVEKDTVKAGSTGFEYVSSDYDEGAILWPGRGLFAAVCVISAAAGLGLIAYYTRHDVWEIEELFKTWLIFAAVLVVLYAVIHVVIKKPVYMIPVLAAELIVTAYIGYGQPHFHDRFSSDPEQSGEYVTESQKLMDNMDIKESRTDRIKNPDTTLNTNYGFVMRRATVGGWANTVPRLQMEEAMGLGYGAHFMRILDSGGTLFSDAALHVTETLTCEPKLYTDEAYEKIDEAEGYTLLKNKNTLPYVMLTNAEYKEEDPVETAGTGGDAGDSLEEDPSLEEDEKYDIVYETNRLYHKLAAGKDTEGAEEDILRDITDELERSRNKYKTEYKYYVNSKCALYYGGGEFGEMKVNGEVIPVPDIGDPKGKSYPGWFNENLLFLGIYEDEEVNISIEASSTKDVESLYILDLEKLEKLCGLYNENANEIVNAGKSDVEISVKAEEASTALIPMAYDEGLKAEVNGKVVDINNYHNMFIEFPVEKGDNIIKISFVPEGLVPGIIVSLIFACLTVLFAIRPVRTKIFDKISEKVLLVVYVLFLTGFYLIPYAAFLIHQIEKRL